MLEANPIYKETYGRRIEKARGMCLSMESDRWHVYGSDRSKLTAEKKLVAALERGGKTT